jgi:DNA-binding MarR family transcriptional regulator
MNMLMTQQLLDRLAGLLRSETRGLLTEHGLQPIQFEALHYLSVCNRYSDTPMAVTEFLGQTKGTVSQSLKVLEKNGLLEKVADDKDKRVTHLKISTAGRELVSQLMPSPLMQNVSDEFKQKEIQELNQSLTHLLLTMQKQNQFKSFGQCLTCQHNIKTDGNEYVCGLTKEALSAHDVELICREHE